MSSFKGLEYKRILKDLVSRSFFVHHSFIIRSLCDAGQLVHFRSSGEVREGIWGRRGGSGRRLGRSWGTSWDHFGRSWDILTPILAPFGLLLGDPKIPLFA